MKKIVRYIFFAFPFLLYILWMCTGVNGAFFYEAQAGDSRDPGHAIGVAILVLGLLPWLVFPIWLLFNWAFDGNSGIKEIKGWTKRYLK